MYDGGKILLGLLIFVAAAVFPLWFSVASGKPPSQPEPKLPQDETACVESKEFMRASHMDLLDDWRDSVVRDANREYVASDGRKWKKSLSLTCMGCHANEAQFCGECHDYLGVEPNCWDCHVPPEGK